MSDDTVSFYTKWKDKYIIKNPYSDDDRYYVQYSEETYSDTHTETAVTVSEAHGYGMLITASMSAHDTEAHDIFDGMYRFYKEHTSSISGNLMAWQQSDNGSALINSNGNDSASDGDIDIAYSFEIITSFTDEYKTGLLPDFIIKGKNNNFVPAPADFLESENDGSYYYNSCRCPWRISMDYLINKEPRALKYAQSISSFFCETSNGEPMDILAGYTLDGKALEDYNDLCFLVPVLTASACTDNTEWHDAVRNAVVEYDDDVYFGDTIKMLCLIIDDGGWIVPESDSIIGDVNADGEFNIADVLLVQKWLLAPNDTKLTNWKAADLCENGVINTADLSHMKKQLLAK